MVAYAMMELIAKNVVTEIYKIKVLEKQANTNENVTITENNGVRTIVRINQ